MRLRTPHASARESIISQAEEGFALKLELENHGSNQLGLINNDKLRATIERIKNWRTRTIQILEQIFPRAYEALYFRCANIVPPSSVEIQTDQDRLRAWMQTMMLTLQNLQKVSDRLDKYTDLPLQTRVYVEDIESFTKVRDINPDCVSSLLKNGRISLEEDMVQHAIEDILGETFHKNDHGGEINDLSTHVKFCGKRRAAAFLLKGRGTSSRELQIADCGSNGDQIVRLFWTPSDLYVVQYVGHVSDTLVADVAGKVEQERANGKDACYCIMNGTDTARLLFAYGFLAAQ